MKRSIGRILTTHVGSLPRPFDLQQLLQVKDRREPYDKSALSAMVVTAVKDAVKSQIEIGIDIVADGEMSKSSFTNYVRDRLSGLDGVATEAFPMPPDDFPAFTALSRRYGGDNLPATGLSNRPLSPGAPITTAGRPLNDGPIEWKNKVELERDIQTLKEALVGYTYEEAFMPAVAVGQVRFMIDPVYYSSEEEYLYALADTLKEEYKAITDAGFIVQIDAPDFPMMRNRQYWDRPFDEYRRNLELRVEALNHALQEVPEDQIRFHVCWGNSYGPHHRDVPLKEILDVVLKVKAQAYSIEAANPRHEHEWELWEDTKLPDGKILIPGVIDSVNLFIEPPELVSQRIIRYANLVGRENVIAAPDCGFGTFSAWAPTIHSEPMWEKLRSMVKGAEMASKKLWTKN